MQTTDYLSRRSGFRALWDGDSQGKGPIDEQYANPDVTLHDVAGCVALSNNHFCTVFSQETGVTFTEYLTAVRLAKAKQLLRDQQMRTSDVAFAIAI